MKNTELIFVYGTLKHGFSNHHFLHAPGNVSEYVGEGSVFGSLYNLGNFPGLVPGPNKVHGELYHISIETLDNIDMLEGFDSENIEGSLYLRKRALALVPFPDRGKLMRPWIYYFNGGLRKSQIIESGRWPEINLISN